MLLACYYSEDVIFVQDINALSRAHFNPATSSRVHSNHQHVGTALGRGKEFRLVPSCVLTWSLIVCVFVLWWPRVVDGYDSLVRVINLVYC